jgi:hypothetical protein
MLHSKCREQQIIPRNRVEHAYNDIGLYDTSSIASVIL